MKRGRWKEGEKQPTRQTKNTQIHEQMDTDTLALRLRDRYANSKIRRLACRQTEKQASGRAGGRGGRQAGRQAHYMYIYVCIYIYIYIYIYISTYMHLFIL